MPVVERTIKRIDSSKKSKGVPTVIKWQGVSMVASQSIRTVAKELVNMSANQDFISVNLIGKQGTGKTELMKTLSHLVLQPFSVTRHHYAILSFFNCKNMSFHS